MDNERRAALVEKVASLMTRCAYLCKPSANDCTCRADAERAIDLIRAETLEEAARVAEKMSDDWATEWRRTLKADNHMEGMSDGADDVAAAIRALKGEGQ